MGNINKDCTTENLKHASQYPLNMDRIVSHHRLLGRDKKNNVVVAIRKYVVSTVLVLV